MRVYLKRRDTRPRLVVPLTNPNGTDVDLSGATAVWLHIRFENRTTGISREMDIESPATDGVVSYTWVEDDWEELIVGEHRMEYEVLGSGDERQTYPNNDETTGDGTPYDTLIVREDLGQE